MEQMQHEDFFDASQKKAKDYGTPEYYKRKWKYLRGLSKERFQFYDIALQMTAIVQIKGLRMVMENPYHPTNFTNHFWFMRTSVIDKNRTLRGDYYRKPTAYWFVGCAPTYGETLSPTRKTDIKTITAGSGAQKTRTKTLAKAGKEITDKRFIRHSSKAGICDEERSMISPDYARNFICDFILGKPQVNTQLKLF